MTFLAMTPLQAVLLAIVRLEEDAYGRAIVSEVSARLQRDVTVGAVHATLVRLEEKEMVSSRVGEGTTRRAGRPRRFYSIEPLGVRALNNSRKALTQMWRGLRWPLVGGT